MYYSCFTGARGSDGAIGPMGPAVSIWEGVDFILTKIHIMIFDLISGTNGQARYLLIYLSINIFYLLIFFIGFNFKRFFHFIWPGFIGPPGIKGDTGLPGQKGDTGLQGERGEHGPRGEAGKDGIDGKDGAKGDKGHQGLPGIYFFIYSLFHSVIKSTRNNSCVQWLNYMLPYSFIIQRYFYIILNINIIHIFYRHCWPYRWVLLA